MNPTVTSYSYSRWESIYVRFLNEKYAQKAYEIMLYCSRFWCKFSKNDKKSLQMYTVDCVGEVNHDHKKLILKARDKAQRSLVTFQIPRKDLSALFLF